MVIDYDPGITAVTIKQRIPGQIDFINNIKHVIMY